MSCRPLFINVAVLCRVAVMMMLTDVNWLIKLGVTDALLREFVNSRNCSTWRRIAACPCSWTARRGRRPSRKRLSVRTGEGARAAAESRKSVRSCKFPVPLPYYLYSFNRSRCPDWHTEPPLYHCWIEVVGGCRRRSWVGYILILLFQIKFTHHAKVLLLCCYHLSLLVLLQWMEHWSSTAGVHCTWNAVHSLAPRHHPVCWVR